MKQLTKQQLWNYITEKQKINPEFTARCQLTKNFIDIPKGTILELGVDGNYISTYDGDTFNRNGKFGYNFDYEWYEYWDYYKGKFISIDDDNRQQETKNCGGVGLVTGSGVTPADNQVEVLEFEKKATKIKWDNRIWREEK